MGPVSGIIISWTLDVKANVFPSYTTSYKTIHPVLHLKNSIACTAYFLSGGNIDMINDCLQAKENIQYKANFFAGPIQKSLETNVTFTFQFYFDKGTKEIREEVLIVTEGNLLGSIGGSLGLFLGFSCFTYISEIIDKVLP